MLPRPAHRSRAIPFALPFCTLLLASMNVAQADDAPQISNPPLLQAAPPPTARLRSLNLMAAPIEAELAPGIPREVQFDLDIRYVNGWIRNPSLESPGEVKYDRVQLRSYVQGDGSAAKPLDPPKTWGPPGQTVYVAPQIEAYPGQTVRITLNNDLPHDPSCTPQGGSANTPHCFNGTNLHSHGLWVNPAGNSDNVLLSINPGVGFQYEYNIPPTHPAGTFWYHTHQHGSTALQVSSGMAGALIVRGTRPPTPTAHGDLDTLLKPYGNTHFPERVLVFQQIQYACRFGKDNKEMPGQIKTYGNDPAPGQPTSKDPRYKCDPGDTGEISAYDQFGPGSWGGSGRYTSINGVVLGKLADAKAGEVERWRMIHAGVHDTIALKIRHRAANAPEIAGLKAEQTDDYVSRYCTGPDLPLPLVAADGLTMNKALLKKTAIFQPGYRWDALVVFPEAGDYCVINDLKTVPSTVDRNSPSTRLLGLVAVAPGTHAVGNAEQYLQDQLVQAAQANMPADVSARVVADLQDHLHLTQFVPHQTITPDEVTGTQTLTFNIDVSVPGAAFFQVDGKPYDGNRIDRVLKLGGVDEWTLTSDFVSHPFHIHVNPFQVVKIIDPNGKDVSAEDATDGGDDEYPGLKGVWKDTLWIKSLYAGQPGSTPAKGKYTIVVRTRYERYVGDFVLHCHILDHEDQGMMQNIRIALPDGQGGVAQAHH